MQAKTYPYGRAFEHFIVVELFRLQSYKELDYRLSYLRTKDNVEIDLIVERPGQPRALIEIKSTHLVREEDTHALATISSHIDNQESFCFSLDPTPKQFGKVRALHWKDGFKELGLISKDF